MKKIIRKSILLLIGVSLFASSLNAAAVVTVAEPVNPISAPATPVAPAEVPKTSIKDALKEFKSLSRKERKLRLREAKQQLKEFKKEKRNGNEPSTNTLLLVILAILLPPLAVYLHEGEINSKFWISLLLTLLFFIPGVIYALIVVLGKD
ncbi:YqaE/Pmp3 family membrane protein [Ferruginibacter sp. HRS2-29]|uniref:YqaE/Pmp3 family membrane protein n=1 Tax=Ferruginibacter sp. HRS2-29 TaxID=2487334 RepID=UPI0020CBD504|nr:YqaE/Pmp3 family membrane protein [Ferruginibacter sp. HRS2-29]MCP9750067.1 YqaE/Pmp3 family membrane protein [Ferruginibacter sp. HRS2-29]